MSEDQRQVQEQLPDHHYRTEIPNIVFELNLDLYSLQLYIRLKKIAGDYGHSYRSVASLSKYCGMGETKIKESMKILQCKFKEIGCSLITVTARFKEDGSPDTNIITINPIWRQNGDYFRGKSKEPKNSGGGSCENGGVGSATPKGGAHGDDKEDPSKEDPFKEELLLGNGVPAEKSKKEIDKKNSLVISDLHAYCIRNRLSWSSDEIEEAFASYSICKFPISDGYEYIGGIIRNKRNMANIRRAKEKSRAKAPRPKGKPLPTGEEESKPKESLPTPDRPWDNDPTLHPLWSHFNPSEKKSLLEEASQRLNK